MVPVKHGWNRHTCNVYSIYPEIDIAVVLFTNGKFVRVVIPGTKLHDARIHKLIRSCFLPPRNCEIGDTQI